MCTNCRVRTCMGLPVPSLVGGSIAESGRCSRVPTGRRTLQKPRTPSRPRVLRAVPIHPAQPVTLIPGFAQTSVEITTWTAERTTGLTPPVQLQPSLARFGKMDGALARVEFWEGVRLRVEQTTPRIFPFSQRLAWDVPGVWVGISLWVPVSCTPI